MLTAAYWSLPITWTQVAAIVSLAAAAGALFGATSSWFQHGLGRAWSAVAAIDFHVFNGAPVAAPLAARVLRIGLGPTTTC